MDDAGADASATQDTGPGPSPAGPESGSGEGASLADAGTDAAPMAPGVRFVGRVDASDPSAVKFEWSGAGFVFRFAGTGARVTLDDPSGSFTLIVDGAAPTLLTTSPGKQDYVVAGGLASGEHVVEVYRKTEAFMGVTTFYGATVDGTLLSPPSAPARRIEVIGDSISCGYGDLGADQTCHFAPATEDHFLAYGAVAARALSAELSTIAWSGIGLVANGDGSTTGTMPTKYDLTLGAEATGHSWNFASWQADVVLVNLGTNDHSSGVVTESGFEAGYASFFAHLRALYPSALLLGTLAPMVGQPDLGTWQGWIKNAIAERVAAGDTRVKFVDLYTPAQGFGCDWHPSIATHAAMAALLETELRADLSW
jgi:lysophospholipase L1-like esterase